MFTHSNCFLPQNRHPLESNSKFYCSICLFVQNLSFCYVIRIMSFIKDRMAISKQKTYLYEKKHVMWIKYGYLSNFSKCMLMYSYVNPLYSVGSFLTHSLKCRFLNNKKIGSRQFLNIV